MTGNEIVRMVGYMTGAIVLIAGILILSGAIVPSYVPSNFRIMAGVMLTLYGLYRPAMVYLKGQRDKREEKEEALPREHRPGGTSGGRND